MSFFAELKRRNVIRVGLAYLVASWLLMQITDVLISLLALPEVTGKIVVLLLAIGLLPALIFSWAYELTPDGLKRDHEVSVDPAVTTQTAKKLDKITIGLVIAVALIVIIDRMVPEQGTDVSLTAESLSVKPADQAQAKDDVDSPAPDDGMPSLAVLPFVNMSDDQQNEYFSDGISEELLNLLVKIDGLRVPSRTSSFAFKGQKTDIREIAAALNVNHILEGSVRKSGNQVRITAQLIDVETDTHLWSERFDRELEDIFAIQDEIATQIVAALQLVLGTSIKNRKPTDNLEAYNLYLQGLYQFQQRGSNLAEAERLLQQAVNLDPQFAEAWAILGLTLIMQPNYMLIPVDDVLPRAVQAADRADAAQPGMAESNMIRANVAAKRKDIGRSVELLEENTRAHPEHTLARLWFATNLMEAGYTREAEQHLQIAHHQDPASGIILDWLARAQVKTGEWDKARANAELAIKFNRFQAIFPLSEILLDAGEYETLLQISSPMPDGFEQTASTIVSIRTGELSRQQGLNHLRETLGDTPRSRFMELFLLMSTNDSDGVAGILPDLLETDVTLLEILWEPLLTGLRNDPRMRAVMYEYGLPEIWRSRGWPDLCRPLGADDFECD